MLYFVVFKLESKYDIGLDVSQVTKLDVSQITKLEIKMQ